MMTKPAIGIVTNAIGAAFTLWCADDPGRYFWIYVFLWPVFVSLGGYWVWATFEDTK